MLKRIENILNEINCYELTEMVEADIDYKNAKTYNEQKAILIGGIQYMYDMFTESGNSFYDDLEEAREIMDDVANGEGTKYRASRIDNARRTIVEWGNIRKYAIKFGVTTWQRYENPINF